ncbi:hypothetical protein BKA62DRAFT_713385 [Auriculariales sp. MPI-PUGE-AT-0066]|nr:hypothetical protein BKA62DRAFT_713385 [Auriculariales sp. MPI-PUGE-AT-0066]
MSAMNIDKPLDDIISDKRKSRSARGSRRGASNAPTKQSNSGAGSAARARYSAGPTPAGPKAVVNTRQAAAAAVVQSQAQSAPSEKIIVNNLPADVNEAQVKELFQSTIGPVKEATLVYDSHGKSKGVANVTFVRRGDGNKAYKEYHDRLIDGTRKMKVEIVVDPSRLPQQSLAARVAPAAAQKKNHKDPNDQLAGVAEAMQGVESSGSRGGRGRGRGRGRGGRGGRTGGQRPKKSEADLDAEMEEYSTNATSAAANPAPAA